MSHTDLRDASLALRGRVLRLGWELPENLSEIEWKEAGELLGKVERSVSWWIGDWWAFGEVRYGDKKTVVESETWDGPEYDTCRRAGTVAKAFEIDRRRSLLSFHHHAEVCGQSLSKQEADALLDWAEEPIGSTGKPRSVRELRGEMSRRRPAIGGAPSDTTSTIVDLWEAAERGRKWGCIYADPPWLYSNQTTRAATGNHYEGMTVHQLCELPIKRLVLEDAHLHLWVTNAFLFDAPKIFDSWGFEFRTTLVWVKGEIAALPGQFPVARPKIGIGNYWRNSHELMLTAVRGNAKRFNDHTMPSWFVSDRGKHSSKPEQVRAMIERASPGPYLELFGRQKSDRWDVWGNQIERNLFAPGEAA